MIKNISAGLGIQIDSNHNNFPYVSPGAQHAGQIHVNTNTGDVEMFDGVVWRTLTTTPSISLDPEIYKVFEWAKEKMYEEQKLTLLLNRYPGLKDTYEKFQVMKVLCSENESNKID